MEENKLKEIEARLQKLLVQHVTVKKTESAPFPRYQGAEVIRRRKGQMDQQIR